MAGISFSAADQTKWKDIIKMLEADMKPRAKEWDELKERLVDLAQHLLVSKPARVQGLLESKDTHRPRAQ